MTKRMTMTMCAPHVSALVLSFRSFPAPPPPPLHDLEQQEQVTHKATDLWCTVPNGPLWDPPPPRRRHRHPRCSRKSGTAGIARRLVCDGQAITPTNRATDRVGGVRSQEEPSRGSSVLSPAAPLCPLWTGLSIPHHTGHFQRH